MILDIFPFLLSGLSVGLFLGGASALINIVILAFVHWIKSS